MCAHAAIQDRDRPDVLYFARYFGRKRLQAVGYKKIDPKIRFVGSEGSKAMSSKLAAIFSQASRVHTHTAVSQRQNGSFISTGQRL